VKERSFFLSCFFSSALPFFLFFHSCSSSFFFLLLSFSFSSCFLDLSSLTVLLYLFSSYLIHIIRSLLRSKTLWIYRLNYPFGRRNTFFFIILSLSCFLSQFHASFLVISVLSPFLFSTT
jgi:hypothetical protein